MKLPSTATSPAKVKEPEACVEGPYIPIVPEMFTTKRIVGTVGNAGLTGAYSLALWWLENRAHPGDSRFALIWTIRDRETVNLHKVQQLRQRIAGISNMKTGSTSVRTGAVGAAAGFERGIIDLRTRTKESEKHGL